MQLAIYLGWRLHGMRGGLTAGLAFIGPAILLLLALSYVYAAHGQVPAIAGMLVGLKAAVVALVLQALLKIGRRALRGPLHVALAIGAFAALQFLHVPFPLIVLGAGLIGLAAGASGGATPALVPVPTRAGRPVRVLAIALVLWVVPLLACGAALGFDSLWSRLYLFFTQAALVTFGGAYAVLGYVTQHLVNDLGWLTAEQAVSGLALAETTPGPLIIVLQFMGFMAGWNQPSPLPPEAAAVLAALLASWATFLPSFVFILVGAPYVERISAEPRVASALAAITAAVVGIIGTLAVLFARVVLLPHPQRLVAVEAGVGQEEVAFGVAETAGQGRAVLTLDSHRGAGLDAGQMQQPLTRLRRRIEGWRGHGPSRIGYATHDDSRVCLYVIVISKVEAPHHLAAELIKKRLNVIAKSNWHVGLSVGSNLARGRSRSLRKRSSRSPIR
jgi:chromate transporter